MRNELSNLEKHALENWWAKWVTWEEPDKLDREILRQLEKIIIDILENRRQNTNPRA